MERVCGIYKITNQKNDKCYIGQSVNIYKRWNNHKAVAFCDNYDGYEYPQYRAIRKYGIDNFAFSIIELCDRNELNEKEIFYIKQYRSNVPEYGYNLDVGGYSPHYKKLSLDKIEKIIQLLKTTSVSADEIGQLYGVSGRTIRGINIEEYARIDGITYPIREYSISNKNGKRYRIQSADKPKYYCAVCGKEITGVSQYCRPCSQRKIQNRPAPEIIAHSVKEIGFAKTGETYGVDANTIKKWCRNYGIPYLKDEVIQWYNEQVT